MYAWPLELGSFQNVRSFVDKFAEEGNGALNVLVANAGLHAGRYTQTEDGWESTYLQSPHLPNPNDLTGFINQAASELSLQCVAEHLALAVLDKLFLSRFTIALGFRVEFCTLFGFQIEGNKLAEKDH